MKWLFGGLLGSLPLVNLILGGYFLRYARRVRTGEGLELPNWNRWDLLLLDSLRMLALQFLFVGVPVLLGWLISLVIAWFFGRLYLVPFAATIAWLPFFLALAISLPLWMSALHRYLLKEAWADVFDLAAVWNLARVCLPALAVPTLAVWGLFFLGWPLLGFAFFLGFGPYVAYASAVYMSGGSASMVE